MHSPRSLQRNTWKMKIWPFTPQLPAFLLLPCLHRAKPQLIRSCVHIFSFQLALSLHVTPQQNQTSFCPSLISLHTLHFSVPQTWLFQLTFSFYCTFCPGHHFLRLWVSITCQALCPVRGIVCCIKQNLSVTLWSLQPLWRTLTKPTKEINTWF